MLSAQNWLTNSLMDFEYKKYKLLAYLKHVKLHFSLNKIYPFLNDLLEFKKEILMIRKSLLDMNGRPELKGIDWKKLKFEYKNPAKEPEPLEEVIKMIEYSIPLIEQSIEQGLFIYNFVEKSLTIEPVGIVPVRNQEGYLFFHIHKKNDVYIYKFLNSGLFLVSESIKTVNINFLEKKYCNVLSSFEQIKIEMIETHKQLPNPAVFRIQSDFEFPIDETFVPVAKKYFEKKMAA